MVAHHGLRPRRPNAQLGLVLIASWLAAIPAFAQLDLDREFEFASGLVDLGFPDFAEKVVEQVLRLHPDQQDRAKLIRAQIHISRRRFDEAEKLLQDMGGENPKAQAIRLALANAHYRLGDFEKAKKIYEEFFSQYRGAAPTDADLRRFYQESAYQFGQMLEKAGDLEGAVAAYDRVLATKPERQAMRKLLSDQAQLYVKLARYAGGDRLEKWLQLAKKNCDEIQWGGLDIWFGHSIITLAHIELVRGDKPGAQKVLKDHMDILRQIDELMKEHDLPMAESPMAGARFLLGELYEEQGQALAKRQDRQKEALEYLSKALSEYYNVFAKYSDSDWASEAGLRAQRVKEQIEAMGKEVKIDLGAHAAKAAATRFRLADNLFLEKQYAKAAAEYLKVLNQFPEVERSVGALANLALSYAYLQDALMTKMVVEYLGERFAASEQAAMALLAVGKHYFDTGQTNLYVYTYETYLRHFPKHDRAAGILYTLGDLRRQAGDTAGALAYYQRVVNEYPKDRYCLNALNQMAWMHYGAKQYAQATPHFEAFIAASQPGPDRAQAQFVLADCYKQAGDFAKALAAYEELINWLAPKDSVYNTSADAEKKNRDLLEKAAFYRGYCFSKMSDPPEAVPEYRAKGIRAYEQFIKLFPQSELAPKAMNGLGAIQLEQGQFADATRTFEDLAQKYPEADEGKSALFSLIRAAMEVQQHDVARDAFAKMIQHPDAYSPEEFGRVGQLMLDARQYGEAIQAFRQVRQKSDQRALLERALFGLGRAHYELGQHEEAAKFLEDLMTRYPKSGLFYDAKFTLGSAYRTLGRLDEAVLALSDVFRYAEDPLLINRANISYAEVEEERGNLESALASYQRVALLADPKHPELRPLVEKSILKSIDIATKLGRYADVVDSCDQYLKLFPEGENIERIRGLRAEARLKAAQSAGEKPAEGTAPGR